MTQASAVLTVVRLCRPSFRSKDDKLAWAVHAYILSQGYRLVAAGAAAEADADWAASLPEVGPDGWDALPGVYAFRYQDSEGHRASLYVKGLSAGPKLVLQWASDGQSSSEVAELDVARFATDEPAAPGAYQRADELMAILDGGLGRTVGVMVAAGASGAAPAPAEGRSSGVVDQDQGVQAQPSGNRGYVSPLQEGPARLPPGVPPTAVGYEDVVPPGVLRPPGLGGISGGAGILEGPPHLGGGMLVGPGHPMFGPGRLGEGVGVPPGHSPALPPGARWDPIGPPGTRGFRPDDFQRHDPSKPHPDMMQPGPDKGADWDAFYG